MLGLTWVRKKIEAFFILIQCFRILLFICVSILLYIFIVFMLVYIVYVEMCIIKSDFFCSRTVKRKINYNENCKKMNFIPFLVFSPILLYQKCGRQQRAGDFLLSTRIEINRHVKIIKKNWPSKRLKEFF